MNEIVTRIVKEGDRQIVEIPAELQVPNAEVTIRKDGDKIVLEPKKPSLREFLDSIEPVDVDWPDVDEGLLPLDDVKL